MTTKKSKSKKTAAARPSLQEKWENAYRELLDNSRKARDLKRADFQRYGQMSINQIIRQCIFQASPEEIRSRGEWAAHGYKPATGEAPVALWAAPKEGEKWGHISLLYLESQVRRT